MATVLKNDYSGIYLIKRDDNTFVVDISEDSITIIEVVFSDYNKALRCFNSLTKHGFLMIKNK